jgi:CheY-like chemotaxis protein
MRKNSLPTRHLPSDTLPSKPEVNRPSSAVTRPAYWPARPPRDPRLAPDEEPGTADRGAARGTPGTPRPGQAPTYETNHQAGAEPPALSPATEEAPQPTVRRRVLVVEDNRDSAASLSVLLELMGHEVRVAYTGPEAVELAAEWPPEITISDIGLPGFDGFEVARRLRGRYGREPLLVALTGYGRDEDRRMSQEAGFDHHLVKPADPAVLQQMLLRKK